MSGAGRKRRPKKSVDLERYRDEASMIDASFLKMVDIKTDGVSQRITIVEAIMRHLHAKEVAGSKKALKVRLMYQRYADFGVAPTPQLIFVDNEYTQAFKTRLKKVGGSDVG